MPSARVVPGTPRWAVWAAWGTVLCLVPSALWRTAIGLGADLGTTDAWRAAQDVPGRGTVYVLALTLWSLAAAGLTLGLVRPWGEVWPRGLPWLHGRRIPTALVVLTAGTGAVVVAGICAMSVARWSTIIGYRGRPAPGWDMLVTAAYLPALLWAPLLLAVTAAYWRRRAAARR